MKKHGIFLFMAALTTLILCFLLIVDSKGTTEAAKRSITVCLTVIIPSLFAFMVFSQIIIKSGIGDILFYPLYKISFWFKGNRREFAIFMLSLIGGYPVGIKLLTDYIAYNKNYTAIAEKMLCYCYCGSPSFIIQIAGISLFGSFKAGLVVYLSNIAACFTCSIINNVITTKKNIEKNDEKIPPIKLKMTDLSNSIESAVKSLGIICGTILAFNIVIDLMDFTGINSLLKAVDAEKFTAAALEISNISLFSGKGFGILPVISGLTSFGGVCILFQTVALSKGIIPLKSFILSRFPIAALSGVYTFFLQKLFPIAIESSVNNYAVTAFSSVNPIATVCLIIMTYILLKDKEVTKS